MKPRRLHSATIFSIVAGSLTGLMLFGRAERVAGRDRPAPTYTHRQAMPTYEYRCTKGHTFEAFQSITDDPSLMGYTLIVHTKGSPAALAEPVRRQIYAIAPSMAIYNEETMEEHVRSAYFLPRLAATLFGVFGCIGLVLAAVGLYGVMSYAVSRRTREIGIRMAMGARREAVERLIVRQGMVLALIAMLLGWPAAWVLSKLASGFLYGIRPHDVLTFTIAPLFLTGIALIACWLPARRAASVDPVQALRTE